MVDLARAAGVSLATVDRVLNGRGGVRPATVERVRGLAERMGYTPNLAAQALSRRAQLTFDVVLPAGTNAFIDALDEACAAAAAAPWAASARLRRHRIHGFDPAALAEALRRIAPESDGIAFVGLDHPLVRDAVDAVAEAGTPVIAIVSDVSRARRIAYVGVDNRAAGRTAGYLMGRFLGAGAEGRKVAVIAGSRAYRGHEEREMGFRGVMRESFPGCEVLPLVEGHDDIAESRRRTEELLAEHPDLAGLYNIGGGNRGIAEALRARSGPHIVYVGHDLTPHSRRFLLEGVMDAVVNQDPRQEARETLRLLLAHHARRDGMPSEPVSVEPTRIDIFVRENLP